MSLLDTLKQLIEELDRVHPNGNAAPSAWDEAARDGLPNFHLAANGQERFFTKNALAALHDLVAILYENDQEVAAIMDVHRFGKMVWSCVADLHADGTLRAESIDASRAALKAAIKTRVAQLTLTHTHYCPSWTVGIEADRPFSVGPVTFLTRDQWIDSVNFSPESIQRFANSPDENARWKDTLKSMLIEGLRPFDPGKSFGLARTMYPAVAECPSLLKVMIPGYELELSKKVGEIVCKAALDSVSLLLAGRDHFFQQALAQERLPPFKTSSIVETNGFLWLPGSAFGPRAPTANRGEIKDYLHKNSDCLEAFAGILEALVDPVSAPHPNLAKRWSTALDWYAEGQRERNDAVALAKIATSLDVLSCGGKFSGILEMLVSLFGAPESTVVVKGRKPQTLKQVVKAMYDHGRSQILHGTEFDRLKSFETSRGHATVIARLALLEAAVRLKSFTGADGTLEFRHMPK